MKFSSLQVRYKKLKGRIHTRLLRGEFKSCGESSTIHPPFQCGGLDRMTIGDRVGVQPGGWIQCFPNYRGQVHDPELIIGDDVYIGRLCHITVCGKMRIGNHVVIADRVYITDCLHGFEDVERPIMPQPLTVKSPVVIEDECWLGNGVCVMPGVTIGKHCVIGANAVVTKDVPPFSVAVGSPAKVARQYDFDTKQWKRM